MPKGIYQRTPGQKRKISEETRQKFRENLAKARNSITSGGFNENVINARRKNATKAGRIRNARVILKNIPLGATTGTEFTMSRTRKFTVVDPVPICCSDKKHWEQKFTMGGYVVVYGIRKEFSGTVRIVWDYKPTIENILDKPILEIE